MMAKEKLLSDEVSIAREERFREKSLEVLENYLPGDPLLDEIVNSLWDENKDDILDCDEYYG